MLPLSPPQRRWLDQQLAAIASLEASGPFKADLAGAPRLDRWQPVIDRRQVLLLSGEVTGHPRLPDGPVITSRLLALDASAGWARTASRWYRLGQSLAGMMAALLGSLRTTHGVGADPQIWPVDPPGFQAIDDLAALEPILAAHIAHLRGLDAADRAMRRNPTGQHHPPHHRKDH